MFYTTPYFIDTSLQNQNVYFQSEFLSCILIQRFCFVKIWLLFKLLQKCELNILRTKLHLPLIHMLDCAVWRWESTCISKKDPSTKALYYMAATDGSRSTVSTLRIQDVRNSRWTAAFLYSVQFLMTELNLWIQDIYFFLHFFFNFFKACSLSISVSSRLYEGLNLIIKQQNWFWTVQYLIAHN